MPLPKLPQKSNHLAIKWPRLTTQLMTIPGTTLQTCQNPTSRARSSLPTPRTLRLPEMIFVMQPVTLTQPRTPTALEILLTLLLWLVKINSGAPALVLTLSLACTRALRHSSNVFLRTSLTRPRKRLARGRSGLRDISRARCLRNAGSKLSGDCARWSLKSRAIQTVSFTQPIVRDKLLTNFQDQQAIDTLLTLAETYVGHANTMGQQSTGTVREAHADEALKSAEADLKVCNIVLRLRVTHC
jgi:hypothetical protein